MNSRPASETTFTVYLPVVNIKTKVSAENKEAPCTGAESILFVDDEEDITIIGKLLLEDQGFRVQTEVNPLNALNAFRNNPDNYDLIFTDMTMPNLTGDALFREVRKICPGIPVILCTGHSDYINQEDALAMGASAYVNKPLRGKELVKVIRYVLDKSKDSTLPP
jgi:DNA-binding NtrC family response regulator